MRFIAITTLIFLQLLRVTAPWVDVNDLDLVNTSAHLHDFENAHLRVLFLDYDVSEWVCFLRSSAS